MSGKELMELQVNDLVYIKHSRSVYEFKDGKFIPVDEDESHYDVIAQVKHILDTTIYETAKYGHWIADVEDLGLRIIKGITTSGMVLHLGGEVQNREITHVWRLEKDTNNYICIYKKEVKDED